MRVLLLTYYFPPVDYGASNRWLRLFPHFSHNALEFTVVTSLAKGRSVDPSLSENFNCVASIHRVRQYLATSSRGPAMDPAPLPSNREARFSSIKDAIKPLYRWLRKLILIPDSNVGWVPGACKKSFQLIDEQKFDLIISTSPSRSVHMAAYFVARRSKIPWIADFRDAWFDYGSKDFFLKNWINSWMLYKVLRKSSVSVFTSKDLCEFYKTKFAHLGQKFYFLPHGIDKASSTKPAYQKPDGEFWLGYIGSMDRLRDPAMLLDVLRFIKTENPVYYNRIRIKLVGTYTDQYRKQIADHECADAFDFIGFVSQSDSKRWMVSCDCLIVLLSDLSWIGVGACASKIYDYFALEKPVLGLVPHGFVYSMIKQLGAGGAFSTHEISACKDWILEFMKAPVVNYNKSIFESLSTSGIASQYNELMSLAVMGHQSVAENG